MTTGAWLSLALLAAAFLAVLAAGAIVGRRRGLPPELTRKLDHVAAGPVALAVPLVLDSAQAVLALATTFLAFLLVTRQAGRLGSVHGIARRSVGAYLYPVAIAATWLAAHDHLERYAVAILALSLADAAGGLVGARWGHRTYRSWGQPKTWEGSLVTFAVTAVASSVALLAGGMPPLSACLAGGLVATVVTLVEGGLPFGLDNLGVPLGALAALATFGSPLAAGVLLVAAAMFGVALAMPFPVVRLDRPSAAGIPPRVG